MGRFADSWGFGDSGDIVCTVYRSGRWWVLGGWEVGYGLHYGGCGLHSVAILYMVQRVVGWNGTLGN